MTANELADELTKMFRGEEYDRLIHEIPDMLRQQAQEIEAFKKELALHYIVQENEHPLANFKPVWQESLCELTEDTECQYCKQGCFRCDARKALTDEEIEEVAKPYCDLQNWVVDKHEFARAILKKASEN